MPKPNKAAKAKTWKGWGISSPFEFASWFGLYRTLREARLHNPKGSGWRPVRVEVRVIEP